MCLVRFLLDLSWLPYLIVWICTTCDVNKMNHSFRNRHACRFIYDWLISIWFFGWKRKKTTTTNQNKCEIIEKCEVERTEAICVRLIHSLRSDNYNELINFIMKSENGNENKKSNRDTVCQGFGVGPLFDDCGSFSPNFHCSLIGTAAEPWLIIGGIVCRMHNSRSSSHSSNVWCINKSKCSTIQIMAEPSWFTALHSNNACFHEIYRSSKCLQF